MKMRFISLFGAVGFLSMCSTVAMSQTAALHVVDEDLPRVFVEKTGPSTRQVLFKIQNHTGKVRFEMVNRNTSWTFDNSGSSFTINREGSSFPGNELILTQNGNLTLPRGVLSEGSSRNLKENFETPDQRELLAKVVDLPVYEWQYKGGADGQRHIGPVAEDFHEAFGLSDPKSISGSDARGITFAAIQGLHQIVREKEAEIAELQAANEQFAVRLAKLEEQLAKGR